MTHFNQPSIERKKICVNIKVRETIADVYFPTCKNEKCVYISTNKMNSFYDCKKCKACWNVMNFLFTDQKPTIMLFGGDGTHCFARKTSRVYEKEKPYPFLKKFLHQSQSPATKRLKWVQIWNKRIRFLMADSLSHVFLFQVILFNFNLQ